MKKIILNVKGMHCAACELLIKEALQDAGIKKTTASFKTGVIEIEFDESKVKEAKIKEAIQKEGYEIK